TSKAAAQTPAPPAAAGRVLTAQDTGPVDLTDQSFIAGTASAYVGGASRAGGRGHVPAHAAASPAGTPAGVGRGRRTQPGPAETRQGQSKARPVQLAQSEWQCDWPQVAVDQAIYEQSVVLRVVVRPDGSVAQASVAQDPGHGFGRAAIACARRTRFTPARDPQGHAIQATSPPIRVRFTR
ncbi:MAG: TonB family protein, partial [Polyangiales bacterium]